MQVPELGNSSARARALAEAARKAQEDAASQPPELVEAVYAYFVGVDERGDVSVIRDISVVPTVVRKPNHDEMLGLMKAALQYVDEESNPGRDFIYAVLLLKTEGGQTLLYDDVTQPVADSRFASDDELVMSLEIVISDLLAGKIAGMAARATTEGLMTMGAQMQRAQAEMAANKQALNEAKTKFGGKQP